MALPDLDRLNGDLTDPATINGVKGMLKGVLTLEAETIFLSPFVTLPLFSLIIYVVLVLDRRRDGSPSRDDTQIGLKTFLYAALAAAVIFAADGASDLLGFILGGFKGGWSVMRGPLAQIATAGGAAFAIHALLLPRTNHVEKPAAERLGTGLVAVALGGFALYAADVFVDAVLAGDAWLKISGALAMLGVFGGVTVLAVIRLGALSGWHAPPRAPAMPMQPPMTGQPMPPPLGGGYPPQGGYPPGGGYPPQGGGGWPTT